MVIINMPMPERCDDCPCIAFRYDDDSPACCVLHKDIEDETKRLPDCPIISLDSEDYDYCEDYEDDYDDEDYCDGCPGCTHKLGKDRR